jgi:hypothetical protein
MRQLVVVVVLSLTLFVGLEARSVFPTSHMVSQQSGNPSVTVWVNTPTHVYHCPGTRWYGNTKEGKYMSQRAAQAAGYRPASGSVCG